MADRTPRLGDVIDDYCPRCRLLLNHDVTSLYDDEVAKVTCRTCHNTHDYRHAQVPPKRKSAKKDDKKSLMEQVLAVHAQAARAAARRRRRSRAPQKRDLWAEIERIKAQRKGPALRAVDVIQKKRDGGELTARGDRLLHPRLRAGRDPRLPGLGLRHGRLLQGDGPGRDRGPHRVHDAHGRGARPLRPARPEGRQALDGRRGRQDEPRPRPARRGLRGLRAR